MIQGGVSTGRTVTDACYLSTQPQLSSGFLSLAPTIGASLNTPMLADYCRTTLSWSAQTQIKASAVYPLPWNVQFAATFQNLPGIVDAASFVATNGQIAPYDSRSWRSVRRDLGRQFVQDRRRRGVEPRRRRS
jgi:hypothetical protein